MHQIADCYGGEGRIPLRALFQDLSGEALVYATIANIGIDFVPSAHPQAAAFGEIELPAAFIGGKPAGAQKTINFLRSIVDIDSTNEEKRSLIALTGTVLGKAIKFTLWGHTECYKKFTRPVMRDSMSRPYADIYCSSEREKYMHKDRDVLDAELKSFLKYLNSRIRSSKFFFPSGETGDKPSLCDIVMYAYLSVLLSIPDKFCPFSFAKSPDEETQEIIQRLRSFLLDFDDFLWQLNAQRNDQIDMGGPIKSAARAALLGLNEPQTTPDEPENDVEKPLLGTEEKRTQNLVFLLAAASVMAAVIYFSPKNSH